MASLLCRQWGSVVAVWEGVAPVLALVGGGGLEGGSAPGGVRVAIWCCGSGRVVWVSP